MKYNTILLILEIVAAILIAAVINGINKVKISKRSANLRKEAQSIVDSRLKDTTNSERSIIKLDVGQKYDFGIGETRFFAKYVDLPKDFIQPKDMFFVGQLDLATLSKYDDADLLPNKGYLYLYCADPIKERDGRIPCSVFYFDAGDSLVRRETVFNTENLAQPRDNCVVEKITKDTERFNDQYQLDSKVGKINFDYFFNSSTSKIFGYYTNCQKDEKEILDISSKYIILLQLGNNVLADGVMTFLIKESDLRNQDFRNVILTYSQS